MCFLLVGSNTYAAISSMPTTKDVRTQALFEAYINTTSNGTDISISAIKYASDFAGNRFTVIECKPTGYYIFHESSGIFVEYSISSMSPYIDYYDNLYYGGPKGYYIKENSTYKNTVIDETINYDSESELSIYSSELALNLMKGKDQKVLDFINNNSISSLNLSDAAADTVGVLSTPVYIPNSYYLSQLSTNCGYKNGGYCGYIAGNLILYYWEKRMGSNSIVDSWYLQPNRSGLYGYRLTNCLYYIGVGLGYGASTVGWQMRNVLISYCNSNGISATSSWYIFDGNAADEIDSGRPVILFGSFWNVQTNSGYISHAVTAYGYNSSTYIVHYGWDGYPMIFLNHLIFGTMTTFRLT